MAMVTKSVIDVSRLEVQMEVWSGSKLGMKAPVSFPRALAPPPQIKRYQWSSVLHRTLKRFRLQCATFLSKRQSPIGALAELSLKNHPIAPVSSNQESTAEQQGCILTKHLPSFFVFLSLKPAVPPRRMLQS